MEKQENNSDSNLKTLWVILSALGLLIIVGAAGFMFFSPDKGTEELKPALAATTIVPREQKEIDPIALSRGTEEVPGILELPADQIEIEVLGSDDPEPVLVIEEPEPAAEPVKPAPVQPAAPVAVKPAEPEYKDVTVQVFWIQVGSYSSLTKAESVSSYLGSKGLTSTVQSRNVEGKAVFRVRIGAFNTKAEAEKFSDQVKNLEGYEQSYVVQAPMVKKVPVNS